MTILAVFDHFLFYFFIFQNFFSCRFDTSGSMLPRLVPKILILHSFCDVVVGVVVVVGGIGDSRSCISCPGLERTRTEQCPDSPFYYLLSIDPTKKI